jgi:anti-anti-sigma factor
VTLVGSIRTEAGPIPVVRLTGEHDLVTQGQVRHALQRELALDRDVIVSLERVSFLDASVIGVLVAAHLAAERSDVLLAVVVPDGAHAARAALALTGMLDSLTVFEKIGDAQRACRLRALTRPVTDPAVAWKISLPAVPDEPAPEAPLEDPVEV